MFIAVTGASGHLGVNLIQALTARQDRVRALVHQNCRPLEYLQVEQVKGDVLDEASLEHAFAGADIVCHLAARISIVRSDARLVEQINIQGTKNVIAACRRARVRRLVHVSSIHAYEQKPLVETLDEARPLVPFSARETPYDRSKAEGERAVRQAIADGLDAVIVNPTGIIGPNDYQPSHFGAALLAIANRQMPVNINAGFNWVDVRDVVDGIINTAEKAPPGARYLLSGHWANMETIVNIVSRHIEKRGRPLILPLGLAKAAAPLAMAFYTLTGRRPLFTGIAMKALESNKNISHDRATRELGYRPRPFEITIRDTLDWFRRYGYLKRGKT